MLNFLRNFRRKEMKSTRYLKYAIGEIFLVVIGILIALTINNWNEGKKQKRVEELLLKELSNALNSDINSIQEVFLMRLQDKENAILELNRLGGEKAKISGSTFFRHYFQSKQDFFYTFDSGPYDALKANGLNQLTNDSLRAEILNAYDDIFPTFKHFMDNINTVASKGISDLESDYLGARYINDNDTWRVVSTLKVENVLQHPSFMKALKLQKEKAAVQRDRIDRLLKLSIKLQRMILKELGLSSEQGHSTNLETT